MNLNERRQWDQDNADIERYMAYREEEAAEDAYQAWASDVRDAGEGGDDSREAWVDHLDSQMPEYA